MNDNRYIGSLLNLIELVGRDWQKNVTPAQALATPEKLDIISTVRELVGSAAFDIDGDDVEFACPTFADQHLLITAFEI